MKYLTTVHVVLMVDVRACGLIIAELGREEDQRVQGGRSAWFDHYRPP
jgi:hypothetical protein